MAGLALYLLIALVSYDPYDPAWSHTVTARPVQNSGGVVGAWFADTVLVAYSGWIAYRGIEHSITIDKRYLSFRTIGFILTLIGGTGLADIHFRADKILDERPGE